jgi:hypothetical protein
MYVPVSNMIAAILDICLLALALYSVNRMSLPDGPLFE